MKAPTLSGPSLITGGRSGPAYWYLSAAIGSSRAAREAG